MTSSGRLIIIFILFLSSLKSYSQKHQPLDSVNKIYYSAYTIEHKLKHTKLELSFNLDSSFVYGKAYVTLSPYFRSMDSVILDAKAFEINNVFIIKAGKQIPLVYIYDGKKIRIKLDKVYKRNEEYTVFVDYIGKPNRLLSISPNDRGMYFIKKEIDGKYIEQIWTQGEPEANSCWFPTIENTQLRQTQEIRILVKDKYKTLSNGLLVSSEKKSGGMRLDVWKQTIPHAPYLAAVIVGDFSIVKDKWRNKEVSYYVEPKYEPYASMIFGNTPEMLEFFSNKFGDFAWEKYSQVVVRDFVSGAMENTTSSVFFEKLQMTDREYEDETYENVISHELSHHWFGNLVTMESWPNLPLNESFASYCEYLWTEYKYGREQADFNLMLDYFSYLDSSPNHYKNLIRYVISGPDEMFDHVSYEKGAVVLHMLRNYVGDEAFFEAVNLYLKENKFKSVEINNLRMAFESVVGEDLNWFFNQWFLSYGQPLLNVDYAYDFKSQKLNFKVQQSQISASKLPVFRLPMYVDVYYGDGSKDRLDIIVDKEYQEISLSVKGVPAAVVFNADKKVWVNVVDKRKTHTEGLIVLQNSSNILEKISALNSLRYQGSYDGVASAVEKYLDSKNWILRYWTIFNIEEFSDKDKDKVFDKLMKMAVSDESSKVRYAIIDKLHSIYPDRKDKIDLMLQNSAINDKSLQVEGLVKDKLFID